MGAAIELRRESIGGSPAILLFGEIDISNATRLARALKESVNNLDHELLLDLSHVTYVDSAGMRVMFDLSGRMKDHQQRLILIVPKDSGVLRSLAVGGLLQSVEVREALPPS